MGSKRARPKAGPDPRGGALLSSGVLFLFFLSGSLGLIYEVVWLRMLILVFGSTQFAISTVLTAFMAGLALGAYVVGSRIDRKWSPLAVYGLFEIGIGLYALAIPWMFELLQPVSRWLWVKFEPSFIGFSLMRFVFVGALLIVPTSLMGGTLPALSRFVTRRRERIGLSVGSLYGVNTFGAVAGTAATGFLLVPWLGVQETIRVAATLNVAVGLAALGLFFLTRGRSAAAAPAGARRADAEAAPPAAAAEARPAVPGNVKLILAIFGASGFIAMIYEIAWTRVLGLVIGSSVYAFTIMLTTFLVGLALGATLMSGLADRVGEKRGALGVAVLLGGTGVSAFVTLTLFHELPYWFSLAFHAIGADDPAGRNQGMLFGLHFLLAGIVMLPPTLFLGGMFPLVVRICGDALKAVGRTVGTAYTSNTIGTIFGSALGGFLVIPLIGIQGSIMAAIYLDLALAALILLVADRPAGGTAGKKAAFLAGTPRGRVVAAGACVAAALIFWMAQPGWDVMLMNSGMYAYVTGMDKNDMSEAAFDRYARKKNQLLYYEEGVTATVMVAKNSGKNENLFLALDGKVDASTAGDIQTQLLVGHVPMLYARTTSDVVVVGYATGMTVGAASLHHIRSLTAVEIEKAVIEASKLFTPYNNDPLSNPKVKIVIGDGRNFLQVTPDKYDVIISEPPNPWMTIAANLFTREYFQMGKNHLKPGGIFCGWVQLYGLPPKLVRAVLRTFGEVFPHISVYMPIPYADLVLLGSERPLEPDIPLMAEKMKDPRVAADLARIGIHSVPDLLSYHVLDDAGARAFAGRGPINTDDNALIEFQAPLSLYAGTRMPNAKALLPYLSDPLKGAVGLPKDPAEVANMYARLGEAFFDRRIAGRAMAAFNAAQALHPTEARAERMLQIQKWFEDRIEELRRQELGG